MGTIWPPLADALINILQVPIGFINTAVGATSTSQWLPGGKIFTRMVQSAKHAGKFRAVLWQQGESDVIENTSTETYVSRLIRIRSEFAARIGYNPPWLLAKSTLHPTVYKKPKQETAIRKAIDILCQYHGFEYGPDTDILDGENRGDMQSMRHFTAIGQYRAALLWFASIYNFLQRKKQTDS